MQNEKSKKRRLLENKLSQMNKFFSLCNTKDGILEQRKEFRKYI